MCHLLNQQVCSPSGSSIPYIGLFSLGADFPNNEPLALAEIFPI